MFPSLQPSLFSWMVHSFRYQICAYKYCTITENTKSKQFRIKQKRFLKCSACFSVQSILVPTKGEIHKTIQTPKCHEHYLFWVFFQNRIWIQGLLCSISNALLVDFFHKSRENAHADSMLWSLINSLHRFLIPSSDGVCYCKPHNPFHCTPGRNGHGFQNTDP